jgi:HlyD family secretion protein
MTKSRGKRTLGVLVAAAGAVAAAWFAWPRPVGVDLATVVQGPMEVTVDDDGKTRVRHIYTVSAPIPGKVLRISHPDTKHEMSLHVGDQVKANETVVAIMQPTIPGFIDVRSREELQAAVSAADAAIVLAEAEISRIQAALEFSRSDLQRAQTLTRSAVISPKALEKAQLDVTANEAALASAKAQLGVRRSERASIAAKLINPASVTPSRDPNCCVQIRAPVTGRVLRIVRDSEATVAAGAPLIDIGDPLDLEVIADLLSSDAVQIKPGAPVEIEGWGGPRIRGRATRVDPAGFLKVSALGIEEQRVRVTIDFAEPPEAWSQLGHDYRVIVHVTTWKGDGVLMVPVAALFRKGDDWAVFSVKSGRARTTLVKVGHRNARMAEILSGLAVGDTVVLHPSDRVSDGAAVAQRDVR